MKGIIRKIRNAFVNKSRSVFTDIYLNNSWNSMESVSGEGSTLNQTQELRRVLPLLIKKYTIESLLDIPCGDYNWMKMVDKPNIKYIGADIVKPLIRLNKKRYKSDNVSFKVLNLMEDKLPKCDLVFVRDCFVHLSFEEINKSIENIKKSGSKYLLTTTFVDRTVNENSSNGGWRPLNLQIAPFNLEHPIEIINEHCTEGDGNFNDKSIALYLISDL